MYASKSNNCVPVRSSGFKLPQLKSNEFEAEWRGGGGDQTSDQELNFICFRHRLVIVEVGDNDFGNYSCLAENDLGKTRGYIELSGEKFGNLR